MASGVRLNHPSRPSPLRRLSWPALALAWTLASAAAWWVWGPDGADRWGWFAGLPAESLGQGHALGHPPEQAQAPFHAQRLELWRWWTAALVHVNAAHLQGNLWACAVVAAWGWAARVGPSATLAWFVAWPLSQALLLTEASGLQRYVGLSATLHAGAAIVCWQLLCHTRGARRAVGAAVAVAIGLKLALEVPVLQALWNGQPYQPAPLPDAPGHVVASHAHGCGVLAGVLAAAAVDGIIAWRRRRHQALTP